MTLPNRRAVLTPLQDTELFSNQPEKEYQASAHQARKLGQYFTPYPIAQFMARWVIAGQPKTVLDPAVGLGVLLRAVIQAAGNTKLALTGYDIDSVILKKAKALLQNAALQRRDYLISNWSHRYDAIICNPPYLHFRQYQNRAGLLAKFQKRLGFTLGGQTNLHTLFLLKSVSQLSPQGRAAYILPPEFLNADYGVVIKQYLLAQHSLKYVIAFDVNENVFDKVLTTSCILLFDRATATQAITFSQVGALDELEGVLEKTTGRQVAAAELNPALKWRTYYQRGDRHRYQDLVPLGTYGTVRRGIATGDNKFFTFNEEKRDQFRIAEKSLLPCLTKASQAIAPFFTQAQWAALRITGKNIYLLDLAQAKSAAAQRYIAWGESRGVHQRYLTSHRQPWYRLEERPPAPILVTTFNRNGLRFIRNEAGVRNLTCFHGLYLNPLGRKKIDLLMAYFLTPVARELFKTNGRQYGEGLEKFEPNDLNQAYMLNLDSIPTAQAQAILKIFRAYRTTARAGQANESLLESLNYIFTKVLG